MEAGSNDKMQMHREMTRLMGKVRFSRRKRGSNIAAVGQPSRQLFHHPAAPAYLDSMLNEVSGGGVIERCASHESSKKSDDWLTVGDDTTERAIGWRMLSKRSNLEHPQNHVHGQDMSIS